MYPSPFRSTDVALQPWLIVYGMLDPGRDDTFDQFDTFPFLKKEESALIKEFKLIDCLDLI